MAIKPAKPQKPDKPKTIVDITDINQLGSQKVNLQIELPDGETVLQIPMRTLTYAEWVEISRAMPPPVPPSIGGPDGLKYIRDDPGYLRALADWNEKQAIQRVLKAIDLPVNGETDDEKIETLRRTLGAHIVTALIEGLTQAHNGKAARIVARAETFHPNGFGDAARMLPPQSESA